MTEVASFPPLIGRAPRVLILGSMPGVESLRQQRYYAHPRNAFWPILGRVFGAEWSEDYGQRQRQFRRLPLALWDVLERCEREGSLDSAIVADSARPNAIVELLAQQPRIGWILFNGAAAERLFVRHLLPGVEGLRRLELRRLPSTSPAHAGMPFEEKLRRWSAAFDAAGILPRGPLSISES